MLVTRLCSLWLAVSAYVLHFLGSTTDEPVDEAWPSVPNMAVGVMLNAVGVLLVVVDATFIVGYVVPRSELGRHPTCCLVVVRKRGKQVAAPLVGRHAAPGSRKRHASA